MRKKIFIFILVLLKATLIIAQTDTISVFFPFNESTLTEQSKFLIDSAIYKSIIASTQPLQIIGYADAVGMDSFNLQLSRRRAAAVKEYLIQSGFSANQITLVLGKGESFAKEPEKPGGNLADRRVDIVTAKRIHHTDTYVKPRSKPATTTVAKGSVSEIASLKVGETIRLDNIYFYAGRHIVRKESDEALNELIAVLKEHPDIRIRIEGHVCCIPASVKDAIDDDTGLEELSINRAAVIRQYLIDHGIAPERLSYVGFGRRYPIISFERSEEDANRNRRVEIRIVQ